MKTTFTRLLGIALNLMILLAYTSNLTANAFFVSQGDNFFETHYHQNTTQAIEKIYPTHSNAEINVLVGMVPHGSMLQVFNLIGKEIATYPVKKNQTLKIDVSNLPKGIYFVRIGNFQQVERFIVHR